MRFARSPPTLLSLLAIILSTSHTSHATPYPRDDSILLQHENSLEPRQCPQSQICGWQGRLCCTYGTYCITDSNGQAQCVAGNAAAATPTAQAGNGNGQWQLFTTTYVETDLVTRVTTYSSFVGFATPTAQTLVVTTAFVPAPTPTAPLTAICNPNLNEISCGPICCASGQFCQSSGSCAAVGGGSSVNSPVGTYFVPASSASASAFIRPTSLTVQTVISTGSATTTIPFQTPIGTDGSAVTGMTPVAQNNGLSGGAIAGIVIGVLLLLFILFIVCLCVCAKGLLDRLLAIFGLGKRARKRRVETTTYVEEHHHSSGGGAAAGGRTWYGGRRNDGPSRPAKKNGNGFGGALGVAGALAALAVLLGLKRRRDRKDEKSDYGSESDYSSASYTSPSK